eukprot:522757_1
MFSNVLNFKHQMGTTVLRSKRVQKIETLGCVLVELNCLKEAISHFEQASNIKPNMLTYKIFKKWYSILYKSSSNNMTGTNIKEHLSELLNDLCHQKYHLKTNATNDQILSTLNEATKSLYKEGFCKGNLNKVHAYKLLTHWKSLFLAINNKAQQKTLAPQFIEQSLVTYEDAVDMLLNINCCFGMYDKTVKQWRTAIFAEKWDNEKRLMIRFIPLNNEKRSTFNYKFVDIKHFPVNYIILNNNKKFNVTERDLRQMSNVPKENIDLWF